jgi:hypothetical protein
VVGGRPKERSVYGVFKSRESKSLFLIESVPLFLLGLNKRLPCLTQGETFFLFMLSGWSSVSVASLMMVSLCLVFLARVLELHVVTKVYAVLEHG